MTKIVTVWYGTVRYCRIDVCFKHLNDTRVGLGEHVSSDETGEVIRLFEKSHGLNFKTPYLYKKRNQLNFLNYFIELIKLHYDIYEENFFF